MNDFDISNGNILAFIGDSVFTLQVREYLISLKMTKSKELQEASSKYVSAKTQAKVVQIMREEGFLSEKEEAVYNWGRNYKSHSKAKNVDVLTYKAASGLEAIWGYWYLNNNPQRLSELWDKTRTIVETNL